MVILPNCLRNTRVYIDAMLKPSEKLLPEVTVVSARTQLGKELRVSHGPLLSPEAGICRSRRHEESKCQGVGVWTTQGGGCQHWRTAPGRGVRGAILIGGLATDEWPTLQGSVSCACLYEQPQLSSVDHTPEEDIEEEAALWEEGRFQREGKVT